MLDLLIALLFLVLNNESDEQITQIPEEVVVAEEYFNTKKEFDSPVILETIIDDTIYDRYIYQNDDILTIKENDKEMILYYTNGYTYLKIDDNLYYTPSEVVPKEILDNIDIRANENIILLDEDTIRTSSGKIYDIIDDSFVGDNKIKILDASKQTFDTENAIFVDACELLGQIKNFRK